MQFNIQIDRDWDLENFWTFIQENDPTIKELYPDIQTLSQLQAHLDCEYKSGRIQTAAKWLSGQIEVLTQIANALSEAIKENWDGIDEIKIYAAACPVCPRFIDENAFFIGYQGDEKWAFEVCAHEMAHFLYFKKLKKLIGKQIDTEYPGYEWLLSEILVLPILNNPRVNKFFGLPAQPSLCDVDVPEEIVQQIAVMWNPDKMLEIHEQARELLEGYYH